MRGSKPTWLSALPPPSALISVPGKMRGRGGGFLDFFPDPPEDPVDPVVGGGGTEVGVFCDIAAATQLIAGGKSGGLELPRRVTTPLQGSSGYLLEDGDGVVVAFRHEGQDSQKYLLALSYRVAFHSFSSQWEKCLNIL